MKRLPKARRAPQPIRPPSRSSLVSPGDRRRTGRERGFRLGVVMLLGGALLLLAPATPAGAAPAHAGMPIAPWVAPGPAGVTAPLQALLAVQQAQLTAPDGGAGDYCGSDVAISGDTALVSAPRHRVGGNAMQGSVYVFVRSGTTWSLQAQLTAADGAGYDEFGTSVALFGDTALVGAYSDDVGVNVDQGSAYVFVRTGTTWSQQAKLAASDGAAADSFGFSVALSRDTALVGAHRADVGSHADQGAAYVFVRSGTTWSQEARLTAADGDAGDGFGCRVAADHERALVGAYRDLVNLHDSQGSAYVFVRSGTTWSQEAKLTASDGAVFDWFGTAVALSGDTALVGAVWHTVGANYRQGSAYVFLHSGLGWSEQQELTVSDGAARRLFRRVARSRRRHGPGRGLPPRRRSQSQPGLGLRLSPLGDRMERADASYGRQRRPRGLLRHVGRPRRRQRPRRGRVRRHRRERRSGFGVRVQRRRPGHRRGPDAAGQRRRLEQDGGHGDLDRERRYRGRRQDLLPSRRFRRLRRLRSRRQTDDLGERRPGVRCYRRTWPGTRRQRTPRPCASTRRSR